MQKTLAYELHQPKRINYERTKAIILDKDGTWRGDLVVMQIFSNTNRKFKFILAVIDNFTKYAWVIHLKNKFMNAVLNGIKHIVETLKNMGG